MKKRKENTVDMSNRLFFGSNDAQCRYSLGYATIRKIAEQENAIVRIGRRTLYNREKLDAYFDSLMN